MTTTRKLLLLSGPAAVLLVVAAAVLSGSPPGPDATAAKVMSFYAADDARQIASALLLAAATPFLVLFAVGLASAAWPREAGLRPVSELFLVAGGALAGGTLLLAAAFHVAVADGADHLSAAALQALNVLDSDAWVAWNAGIGVLILGAAACLSVRMAASRWLAWTGLVLGVLLFVPFADFFALLAGGLWILVVSGALLRGREGTLYVRPDAERLARGKAPQPG